MKWKIGNTMEYITLQKWKPIYWKRKQREILFDFLLFTFTQRALASLAASLLNTDTWFTIINTRHLQFSGTKLFSALLSRMLLFVCYCAGAWLLQVYFLLDFLVRFLLFTVLYTATRNLLNIIFYCKCLIKYYDIFRF